MRKTIGAFPKSSKLQAGESLSDKNETEKLKGLKEGIAPADDLPMATCDGATAPVSDCKRIHLEDVSQYYTFARNI